MNDVKLAVESQIRAEYLTAGDLKLAASLLFQAYHDDPVFMDIFGRDDSDYEQSLRASIREELAAFWQAKQPILGLYLGEALVGVACLQSSDSGLGPDRFWHWRLKMLLSAGYFSTKQMIEKEKLILSSVKMNKFHILSFIAIHPLHQHHGFGHYLMAAVNTMLDEDKESEGVAVYVTTDKYQKFFSECDYETVSQVKVGNVEGPLMVHFRQN